MDILQIVVSKFLIGAIYEIVCNEVSVQIAQMICLLPGTSAQWNQHPFKARPVGGVKSANAIFKASLTSGCAHPLTVIDQFALS